MSETPVKTKSIKIKDKLTVANGITTLRLIGSVFLCFFKPRTPLFLIIYTITGLTDFFDGLIARKTGSASRFGAILDSVADLVFYSVTLIKLAPVLWQALPMALRYLIPFVIIVKLTAYAVALIKYHRFTSLHTVMNKLTGFAVFLLPYTVFLSFFITYCWIIVVVALLSAVEELLINLSSKECCVDVKSIFIKEKKE